MYSARNSNEMRDLRHDGLPPGHGPDVRDIDGARVFAILGIMGSTVAKRSRPRKATKAAAATKRARPSRRGTAIRNYRGALNFLSTKTNYERMVRVGYNSTNFNLSRMLRILAGLGNPQRRFRSIHIAGTKGKGSTAHMLAAVLKKAGYRTGLYTSPHILDLRERISIDAQLITEAEFTRLMARIAPVITPGSAWGSTTRKIACDFVEPSA